MDHPDPTTIDITAFSPWDCAGLGISPSVYTTLERLDRFCEEIEWVIENGLLQAKAGM